MKRPICPECGKKAKKLYVRKNNPKREWVCVDLFSFCDDCGFVPTNYKKEG